MNKIFLSVDGQFDSNKLCTALKRMVLDPSKEVVNTIQYNNMEYIDEGEKKTKNFFMGNISSIDDIALPKALKFRDSDGVDREIYCAGVVDKNKVLSTDFFEDSILTPEEIEVVHKNPELIIELLIKKYGRNAEYILGDYKINSMYAYLDMNPNDTYYLVNGSYREPSYYAETDNSRFVSNSKEVLDYIGVKYTKGTSISVRSDYSPKKFDCLGICVLDSNGLMMDEQNKYPVGNINHNIVQVNSHVYTFKSKNK